MADERKRVRLAAPRVSADASTLAAWYVIALTVIPSGLILKGIPLSITPATVVALVMTICWLCAHFSDALGMAKGFLPVRTALYAYLLSLLVTYCWAMYRYTPSDEIKLADHSLVLIVALVGMALLICDGVTSRERLDFLLKVVAAGCSVAAVVGALQYLFDLDLTKYLALPVLKFSSTVDGFVFERQDLRRVAGTTGNPIEFGVLCAMAMPLVLHFAFRARREGTSAWRWWACAGVMACGLLFSVSRSAVLGMGCAGVILLAGWPARRRIAAVAVTLVFLALSRIAFPNLLGTLLGLFLNVSTDDSVQYRTHDYPIAADEISHNPVLGRGVGTFYAPKHIVFDNQYLLTLVESGVVGLLVMLALFLVAMGTAMRLALRSVDTWTRELGYTLAACVVVPAIGSVTFDLLSFKVVAGALFVMVGAVGALHRIARRESPHLPARVAVAAP